MPALAGGFLPRVRPHPSSVVVSPSLSPPPQGSRIFRQPSSATVSLSLSTPLPHWGEGQTVSKGLFAATQPMQLHSPTVDPSRTGGVFRPGQRAVGVGG